MVNPFVAVHIGAGKHGKASEAAFKELCNEVCLNSMRLLRNGQSAINVTEEAIKLLENHPMTNAGIGSYLNWDGMVECDAAIMDGSTGLFGCVAAVPNLRNPISLARKILDSQYQVSSELVPPMFEGDNLMGQSGLTSCLEVFDHWEPLSGPMTTKETIEKYKYQKERIKFPGPRTAFKEDDNETPDTVGVVVLDSLGNVAVGVSTGGISLKPSGRIGGASVPGSGFWAIKNERSDDNDLSIACCTTGTGEQLLRNDFARNLCNQIDARRGDDEDRSIIITEALEKFLKTPFGQRPAAGFITIIFEESNNVGEFWYGFTTESIGIGYMSANDEKPTSLVDRLTSKSRFRLSCKSL